MATQVLDLELQALPDVITLSAHCDRALALIRYGGQPVGRAMLPAPHGRIAGGVALRDALVAAAGWPFWERWLHSYLEWEPSPATEAKPPPATVAICTRDRPHDLQRCLDALMALPNDGQEVLVIDNCPSSDATQEVVAGYERVRYVREDQPGLDVARNRAVSEAHHEIVAFIDDDAVPDPGWLRALARNFDHPLVACVTGLTMPLELETEAQEWFERYSTFERGFRRTVFDGRTLSPLAAGRVGSGASMAFRRRIFELVGPFNETLDSGTPTHSGGDTDMFARILAAGYRIVFDPAALNWHRHRQSWKELRHTLYGYGVGVYAYWTHHLLCNREVGVLLMAWQWFRYGQCPTLVRSLLHRRESVPLDLILAEIRGCAIGPWAYISSWRQRTGAPKERSDVRQPDAQDGAKDLQRIDSGRDATDAHGSPAISVIIPTHNRNLLLLRTLDALSGQNFPSERMEVIVVADGCTDGTVEMLRTYQAPFILHVIEQPNRGASVARNRGATQATGRILLFLDDDIEPGSSLVETHARMHADRPGRVVIGYYPLVIEQPANLFQIELRQWWEAIFQRMAAPGHRSGYWDLLSGNLSLDAELFARVGGFDPDLRAHEDYEIGIRLLQAGASLAFASGATGYHHETTSLSKSFQRKYDEGRADVKLAHSYPTIRPSLPLAHFLEPWSRICRTLRALAVGWPSVGDRLVAALMRGLDLIEWLRMRRYWRGITGLLLDYWYWRGASAGLHGRQAKAAILQAGQLHEDGAHHEIDLDLSEGLEAAERRLDQERPDGAHIRLGPRSVGRIPPQPGAERLRGVHLRRILATDLAWPLLLALVGNDALDEPSQIINNLNEACAKALDKTHAYTTTLPLE